MKIHPVFHVSLLESYKASIIPNRISRLPSFPIFIAEGKSEWEVDKILNSKYDRKRLFYLVRWKDYPITEILENQLHISRMLLNVSNDFMLDISDFQIPHMSNANASISFDSTFYLHLFTELGDLAPGGEGTVMITTTPVLRLHLSSTRFNIPHML